MTTPGKTTLSQRALLSIYSALESVGVLDSRLARSGYARAYFAYKRYLEDPYAALARRHPDLFSGGDVLDVGANIGYTATVFAQAADPGRRVYAFEPEGRNFELLQYVVASHGLAGRVVPIRAAVGREEGFVELLLNRRQPSDHRVITPDVRRRLDATAARETVPVVTLDDFASRASIERVSFVKIDVQGYEMPVCEGMERLLEHHPGARVALEYAPVQMAELGFDPESPRAFFEARGYRWYLLARDGRLTPWDTSDSRLHRGYCDVIASRGAIA